MNTELYSHTNQELKDLWGQKFKNLRLEANISQSELAKKAGLSRSSIAEIEKGRNFSIDSLLSILRIFNKLEELSYFFTKEEYQLSPMEIYLIKKNKRKRGGYKK